MRDRLVHHYFDINLDVLWSTEEGRAPDCPPRRFVGRVVEGFLLAGWDERLAALRR